MVSDEQKKEMTLNLARILKEVSPNTNIGIIAEKTGIPRSTVRRYLNRKDLYLELFDNSVMVEDTFQKVQAWLQQAKAVGLQKGGQMSQTRYEYSRDEVGKFEGFKRK